MLTVTSNMLDLLSVICNSKDMSDTSPRRAFAQRLRALRSQRGVSTLVVAETVLGSKDRASDVTKWESGKHFPSPENLVKVADYFCCSTDYLLGVTGDTQQVELI